MDILNTTGRKHCRRSEIMLRKGKSERLTIGLNKVNNFNVFLIKTSFIPKLHFHFQSE